MKAPATLRLLLCGLVFIGTLAGRAEDKLQSLFCTMRLGGQGGGIYTIYLRVPAGSSGECHIVNVIESSISGPPSVDAPPPLQLPNVPSSNSSTILWSSGGPGNLGLINATRLPEIGTLTTLKGTSYDGCRLLTLQKNAIIVAQPTGVTKLLFSDLDAGSFARVKVLQPAR